VANLCKDVCSAFGPAAAGPVSPPRMFHTAAASVHPHSGAKMYTIWRMGADEGGGFSKSRIQPGTRAAALGALATKGGMTVWEVGMAHQRSQVAVSRYPRLACQPVLSRIHDVARVDF